jgi:hypothetical protein
MAFTRTNHDEARTIKRLQQSTDVGRWILNVPGNGIDMPLMEDPHIRIQKWGANLRTNTINLESSLQGRYAILGPDVAQLQVNSSALQYPRSRDLTTDQSRATLPAFTFRESTRTNPHFPLFNPQNHIYNKVPINTRIVAKSEYEASYKSH